MMTSVAEPHPLRSRADELDEAFTSLAAASARVLELVVKHADRKVWERDGATSMTRWLMQRFRVRRGTAQELVRMARALSGLPVIRKAHLEGELSFDQVQPLSRFATAERDEEWARRARAMSAGQLWREWERHQRIRAKDALDGHAARSARMWWDDERPILHFEADLPGEQGAAVEKALGERFERIPAQDATGEPLPPDARMADAFVDAVTGGGADTTLVVHAAAEVLTREAPRKGPWLAETVSGTRLCTEAVRRLACDSRVEWTLEAAGRPVGVGRRGRTIPPHIARVLRHRDRESCRFPGCERRHWLKAHHIMHWADGGRTDLENLIMLCHAHHQLLHEGGWRVRGDPARRVEFRDPHGRPLRR